MMLTNRLRSEALTLKNFLGKTECCGWSHEPVGNTVNAARPYLDRAIFVRGFLVLWCLAISTLGFAFNSNCGKTQDCTGYELTDWTYCVIGLRPPGGTRCGSKDLVATVDVDNYAYLTEGNPCPVDDWGQGFSHIMGVVFGEPLGVQNTHFYESWRYSAVDKVCRKSGTATANSHPDQRRAWYCPPGFIHDVAASSAAEMCVRPRECDTRCESNPTAGNPVRLGHGAKLHEERISSPTTGPEFTLYYNSQARLARSAGPKEYNPMRVWSHNWSRSLAKQVEGANERVVANRWNRAWKTFIRSGNTYIANADEPDRLTGTFDAGGVATGWRYYSSTDDSTETYDATGRLLSISNALGVTSTPAYNANGMLASVQDSLGRTLTFAYDASNRLMSITDAQGNVYPLGYDSVGNLSSIAFPGSASRQFLYNEAAYNGGTNQPHALTGIVDENGQRFGTYTYSSSGRVAVSEQAGGVNKHSFAYSTNPPSATTVTDPLGVARTYTYGTSAGVGRLIDQNQPCGTPGCTGLVGKRLVYDSQGNVSWRGDWNGNMTNYVYDMSRNLETRRTEGGSFSDSVGGACPTGTTRYVSNYGSSCTNGTCWSSSSPFVGSREASALGYPGQYYSCTGTLSSSRTTSTEWHGVWRLPKRIAEPKKLTTYVYNGDVVGGVTQTCAPTTATVPSPTGTGTVPIAVVCKKTVQETTDATGAQGFAAALVGTARNWTYTYNQWGSVLTAKDPLNKTTTYTYYADTDTNIGARGNLFTLSNALGHVTTLSNYDGNGRVGKIVDANGLETLLTYHPRGWLTQRKVGSSTAGYETTTYDYDGVGQLTKVTLPDSSFISYSYDAAHRLTQVQDGLGNKIVYTLDNMGNRIKEDVSDTASQLARTRSRVYDALNRLQKDIGGTDPVNQVTQYAYDAQGNLTSTTDPLARVTTNAYDALNRLVQVTDPQAPTAGITKYEYDGQDNLSKVTDPKNLATTYTYNGFGEMVQQVSPDTGSSSYSYDLAGNLTQKTDARGATAKYTYDALNRVATIKYFPTASSTTAEETITYTYDANGTACANAGVGTKGRVCKLTDGSGNTAYSYDLWGRVVSKTQTVGSGASAKVQTTTYSYNASGQLTGMTTASGQAIGYSYTNNRITGITLNGAALISTALYEPFGPIASWTWANGLKSYRDYDLDGRITTWELRNGTSLLKNTLTWDKASRITALADTINTANNKSFGYDNLDRLLSVTPTAPQPNLSYGYDLIGNRTTSTQGSTSTGYAYGNTNHWLASLSGAQSKTFTYDAVGNQLTDGTYTWAYDNKNRMKSVSWVVSSVTQTQSYSINALGQRLKKTKAAGTAPQATVHFTYDEAGRLTGEYNANNQLVQEVLWLDDMPFATLRPRAGQTLQTIGATGQLSGATIQVIDAFHIHADHLNTPRVITRPSDNKKVWEWVNTEPFGNNPPNENPQAVGTFTFNLAFPGQYRDKETGLNYNYFRDYNPTIGRYQQSDPIGTVSYNGIGLRSFLRQASGVTAKSLRRYREAPEYNYLYAYVNNNPLETVDELGLYPSAGTIGARGFGGAIGGGIRGLGGGLIGVGIGIGLGGALSLCEVTPRERCERDCDKEYDRGRDFCRAMSGTRGRDRRTFQHCMAQVDEQYVACYQACSEQ